MPNFFSWYEQINICVFITGLLIGLFVAWVITLALGEECEGNAFGSVCLSVCMSVRMFNSKTTAPIALICRCVIRNYVRSRATSR